MPTPPDNPNIRYLWPTPILTKGFEHHQEVNGQLIDLFYTHREKHPKPGVTGYASRENLTQEYKDHDGLSRLTRFIMDSVFEIASTVNGPYWKHAQDIDVLITGMWFQITNRHGFHETHIHGNCSWSGVYYVQTGECSRSLKDKKEGLLNGITRFYGPNLDITGGGHCEFGNLYLQHTNWDSYPRDGHLVVFPSHLKHMAFPYNGNLDRIIVSFHAQVHGTRDLEFGYAFD